MELSQLRAFVTVIESGSFTRASDELYVTQSGVSRAVASLESELGVRLLVRSRAGIGTTDAGERLLEHARVILSRVESIRQGATDSSELRVGRLRLGGFPSVCARLLPGLVRAFERDYPGVEVSLSEGSGQEVAEWVRKGSVDVGFTSLPVGGLEGIPIAVDRMFAVLPPDHPGASAREPLEIGLLPAEDFILPRGHDEEIITGVLERAGIVPRVKFTLRDATTILSMVEEGLGWSIVNEMSLPRKNTGVCVKPIEPSAQRQTGLAVRRQAPLPAIRAFVEFAREWAASKGYLQGTG